LRIKKLKPGSHQPRCPHCRALLGLTIDEDGRFDEVELLEKGPTDPNDSSVIDEVPLLLGGYRISKRLGQGGMGTVYLAKQLSLNRDVALKVLHPDSGLEKRLLARFLREAHAAAKLSHPHIVQIYDIANEGKFYFFSMEYVDGPTLAQLVRDRGPLDPGLATNYILQAARGLQFAHDAGLVHRDIKPDNLMVNEQGILKVADLGLVKTGEHEGDLSKEARLNAQDDEDSPHLTRLGTGMGTASYSSPEQLRDAASVDARADIYSLGCTFYALLQGRPPFLGESGMEVMLKHLSEAPTPPRNLPPAAMSIIWPVLSRMLAKDPNDRYASMSHVIAALETSRKGARKREKPTQEDVSSLTHYAEAFRDDPYARSTPRVLAGLVVASLFAALVALVFDHTLHWTLAFGLLPFWFLLWRGLIRAFVEQTVVGTRLRDYICYTVRGWIVSVVLVGGIGALTWWGDLYYPVLGSLLGGLVVGGSVYVWLDRVVVAQRQEEIDNTQKLLQRMRVRGMSEEGVRYFVASYTGSQWEEFYEAMFGYDALVQARAEQIPDATGRPREYRTGPRDALIAWIDRQLGRTPATLKNVRTPTPPV